MVWYVWCGCMILAQIWALNFVPDEMPPERGAFEERHRIAYDIYAAGTPEHAYDLLSSTFSGSELDRQYCFFAKAERQLNGAQAAVYVWDLLYQDFRVLEVHGANCKVYAKWTVTYVLSHSQHSHIRGNTYEAEFDMHKSDDGWKIVGSRIINENSLS